MSTKLKQHIIINTYKELVTTHFIHHRHRCNLQVLPWILARGVEAGEFVVRLCPRLVLLPLILLGDTTMKEKSK
jgi:hypothetical protein